MEPGGQGGGPADTDAEELTDTEARGDQEDALEELTDADTVGERERSADAVRVEAPVEQRDGRSMLASRASINKKAMGEGVREEVAIN